MRKGFFWLLYIKRVQKSNTLHKFAKSRIGRNRNQLGRTLKWYLAVRSVLSSRLLIFITHWGQRDPLFSTVEPSNHHEYWTFASFVNWDFIAKVLYWSNWQPEKTHQRSLTREGYQNHEGNLGLFLSWSGNANIRSDISLSFFEISAVAVQKLERA